MNDAFAVEAQIRFPFPPGVQTLWQFLSFLFPCCVVVEQQTAVMNPEYCMKKETKTGMSGIEAMLSHPHPVKRVSYPLLNWPYCVDHLDAQNAVTNAMIELRMLQTMRNQWNWQWDPETIAGEDYQALVVTGMDQVILWASEGFLEMTGYAPAAAIGRKPSFLQGADTSETSKALIREAIRTETPVSTTILNYKQDGAPYHCHLELLPLRHLSGRVTHFLALEKEL